MTDSAFQKIENAANAGAYGDYRVPEPTEAQRKAGNYKMGRLSLHGLPVAIEQPRGSYRSGKNANGTPWVNRMAAHYGYFVGTKGADGDGVDCFVGYWPQAEGVYVVNQFVDGKFDEHKVCVCFPDEAEAKRAYLSSYDRGWKGLESIVPLTIEQLKWWLRHGEKSHPLRLDQLPTRKGIEAMKVQWNSDALPYDMTVDQVLYQVRISDSNEGLLLDAVSCEDILAASDGVLALDALVTPYATLTRKMAQLRIAMERAGGVVKPIAMQVTDPFKLRGVANVAAIFELSDGQSISIYFHNPDTTPSRMAPADEVISWKWLLNKKDITIVVAPERGGDLNAREVARRIMRLAEKNSPAFQRANAKRGERMANIQSLNDEISGLEKDLAKAQRELEVARAAVESAPVVKQAAANEPAGKPDLTYSSSEIDGVMVTTFLPNTKEGIEAWKVMNSTGDAEGGKVLTAHLEATIRQLRDAGYTVEDGKAVVSPKPGDDETVLAELAAQDIAAGKVDARIKRETAYAPLKPPGKDYILISDVDPYGVATPAGAKAKFSDTVQYFATPAEAAAWGEANGYSVAVASTDTVSYAGSTYTELNLSEEGARDAWSSAIAASGGDTFAAAKDVYRNTIQGHFVKTNVGNVLVTGSGWQEIKGGLKKDTVRALTVPFIPYILKTAVGAEDALYKPRDDFDLFYVFETIVQISDALRVDASVKVGRKTNGKLVYFLNPPKVLDSANGNPQLSPGASSASVSASSGLASEPTPGPDGTPNALLTVGPTLDETGSEIKSGDGWDGVNLQILHVWDKDGNELDPETLEPLHKNQDDTYLPEGWTESRPGGLATSTDEVSGGIVDQQIVNKTAGEPGGWFVVAEHAGVAAVLKDQTFDTRKAAFEALAAEVSKAVAGQESGQEPDVAAVYRAAGIKAYGQAWSDSIPDDFMASTAEAVAEAVRAKDVPALRSRNFGDAKASAGSRAVFEFLTGLKLPKGRKATHDALDAWAGITPEQRAEIESARDAARESEWRAKDVELAWRMLGGLKVRAITGDIVDGQQFLVGMFSSGYTDVVSGRSPRGGVAKVYGISNGAQYQSLNSKNFNGFLKTALAYGGLQPALLHVGAIQATEGQAESGAAEKIAAVDAAYQFADATIGFKLWVSDSMDESNYSPFATAKAMDQAAKHHGAEVAWGEYQGAALDSVHTVSGEEFDGGEVDTLIAMKRSEKVEDGDVPSKASRDSLVERGFAERGDGFNWLTDKGKELVATLDDATTAAPVYWGRSWLGFKLMDVEAAMQASAGVLPSLHQLAGTVRIMLDDEGVQLSLLGTVVGTTFRAGKVLYSVAVPIAPMVEGRRQIMAVLSDIDSALVAPVADDAPALDSVGYDPELRRLSGVVLDDVSHAVASLEIALATVENNEPINRAEGNADQADLEVEVAASLREALAILAGEGYSPYEEEVGHTFEATEITLDDGAYLDAGKEAVSAANELIKFFRDFIRSDADLSTIPEDVSGLPELLNLGGLMDKRQAQRALAKLVDIAINRKAGAELSAGQEKRFADFRHDARIISDYLNKRIRRTGSRSLLRTPEMKAKYPYIDNQPREFDSALDSGGEDLIKTFLRGHKGPVFYKQAERVKDPRFIPLYDKSGKALKDGSRPFEVHQDNLFETQAAADASNKRVRKAWGMDSAAFDGVDEAGYRGKVRKDGKVVGRIDIGGDGKAMVFVGVSGDERVTFIGRDGERIIPMYSDDDAGELIDALFENSNNEEKELIDAAIEAMKRNELAKIFTSDYFTFDFDGNDAVVSDELRAKIEASIGEPLVEAVLPGLEGQVTLVPKSSAPAADTAPAAVVPDATPDSNAGGGEDAQTMMDRNLFQSVIDGTAANLLAPDLADQLEAAYLRHQEDPEMASLFEQAVNAYQAAMLAATADVA